MSKIVKAKVDIALVDVDVLQKTLAHFGNVIKQSDNTLVLLKGRRKAVFTDIEFRRNHQGVFEAFHDDMDSWAKLTLPQIGDRYIAHHYETALVADGYDVNIVQQHDGSLELVAEEGAW